MQDLKGEEGQSPCLLHGGGGGQSATDMDTCGR